jgi:hypothetical protein
VERNPCSRSRTPPRAHFHGPTDGPQNAFCQPQELVMVHDLFDDDPDFLTAVLTAAAIPTSTRTEFSWVSPTRRPGDQSQCRRLETTLMTKAMITVPNKYENIACTRAIRRIGLEVRFVSDTWKVIPMVNAK